MVSMSDVQMYATHSGFILEQDNSSGKYVITPGENYDLNKMMGKFADQIERQVIKNTILKAASICSSISLDINDPAFKCAVEIQEWLKKAK